MAAQCSGPVRGAPAGSLSIYVGQGDDAEIFRVKQVAADADNDMALLKIEGKKLPALRLFMGKPLSEGEEVAFTGYPVGAVYGLYPATHRGIVSAITQVIAGHGGNVTDLTTRLAGALYVLIAVATGTSAREISSGSCPG